MFPSSNLRILIASLLLLPCLSGWSQYSKEGLDRMKREANALEGHKKVTAYTILSKAYSNSEHYQADSALLYSEKALKQAVRISYDEGKTMAAYRTANIALQLSQVNKGLELYRLTLDLAREKKDQKLFAMAIYGIGNALWYQGKFKSSIDTLNLAISEFNRLGMFSEIDDVTMMLSSVYSDRGDYESAFEVAQKALRISTRSGDRSNIVLSLVQLGYLYRNIGDHATAMEYFKKGFKYNPAPFEWSYRHLCNRTGDLYLEKKQYDSAFYFYSQSIQSHAESKTSLLRMADYWLARKQYTKAQAYFNKVYKGLKDGGEGNLVIFALLGLGKTALAKQDPQNGLRYGYEGLAYARMRDSRLTLRDAYQVLYSAYEALGNGDSALYYYKRYMQEKEAVVTDQFKGRLYAARQASQIKMLEKENSISEQMLKNNRLLRNVLAGGILAIVILGMVVLWNFMLKRKNEKLKHERIQTELRRRASELEMQALRAQMNPHFIFNALSSVNHFILKNDPDQASDYLTRFSRLIRLVLINSQKEVILLEEEMEMLRLYLQMEQLRFRNAFEYSINYGGNIDPGYLTVPPLLLQPFCENAIWHGMMHGEAHGMLTIDFYFEKDLLVCTISDNGIGREKAAALGSKSAEKIKSLGIQLTKERLSLFNDGAVPDYYEMKDINDNNGNVCGTKVILRIKHSLPRNPRVQA
jgi:tetratricopeptide (TPR) repeat protein